MMCKVRDAYAADPSSLPYHLIVPSLPGYAFSSISVKKNFTTEDAGRIFHKLMMELGFEGGYVVQGGDVGSGMARKMVATFDEIKGMLPWNVDTAC